jgi:hypothetical protein
MATNVVDLAAVTARLLADVAERKSEAVTKRRVQFTTSE